MKLHSDLTWEPPTDIIETEHEIVVIVEVPGMNGKDIDVVTDGKVLKVSGKRRIATPRIVSSSICWRSRSVHSKGL